MFPKNAPSTPGTSPGSVHAMLPAVSRAIDALAITLLFIAAGAFAYGVSSIGDHQDLRAVYLLVVGGLSLRSATEILRPRGAG